MKTSQPPKFTPFNKRDMVAFAIIVAPLFFIFAIAVYFHEFVLHAIMANVSINLGIITAASFGFALIVVRLIAAQQDFRIIERFGFEATQGVYMKTLLEQPWLSGRYVRHYLSHIANTGGTLSTQMEQSAIESELHALQSDYDSRLELPQFLVGFMIAMGLLGTFIGLLETLTGISGMLDGMGGGEDVQKQFMRLVVELRKPLAGMGIAFSASMFGLVTSLMLAIMMTNLRRYISRVMSLARNVMHELTEMRHGQTTGSRGSLSPNDIRSLLEEETSSLRAPIIYEGRDENFMPSQRQFGGGLDPAMSGRFEVLTKKIEDLLTVFQANTESTKRLNDLLGFGPRMKEINEKTLEEIQGLAFNSGEQHKLLESLLAANTAAASQIHKLSSQMGDVKDVGISSGRHLNEIKENFTKLCQSSSMVEVIATGIGGQTALLEALIEETRRSQQALAAINRSIITK